MYLKNLKEKILVSDMTCAFKVIHYYLQMYLKTLEKNVLEHMNLIVLIFLSEPGLAWQAYLKNRNRIRTIN